MQTETNAKPKGVLEFLSQVVENAASLPGELIGAGHDLNNELIGFARDLESRKQATASNVETQLKNTKIQEAGSKAAQWLSNPTNMIMVVGIIISIILALRK